jgi:hypothetical protein
VRRSGLIIRATTKIPSTISVCSLASALRYASMRLMGETVLEGLDFYEVICREC